MDYAGRSLKAQLRRADKVRARYVLIVGDDELKSGRAQLRDMNDSSQQEVALDNLAEKLGELLN